MLQRALACVAWIHAFDGWMHPHVLRQTVVAWLLQFQCSILCCCWLLSAARRSLASRVDLLMADGHLTGCRAPA